MRIHILTIDCLGSSKKKKKAEIADKQISKVNTKCFLLKSFDIHRLFVFVFMSTKGIQLLNVCQIKMYALNACAFIFDWQPVYLPYPCLLKARSSFRMLLGKSKLDLQYFLTIIFNTFHVWSAFRQTLNRSTP